jgi:hypothetical protein
MKADGKSRKEIYDAISSTATKRKIAAGQSTAPVNNYKPASKPKVTVSTRTTPKPTTKPTAKPTLTKAEKGIAKELSPKGVAAAEKMAKKAIDKKYPGLYKKAGK